MIIKTKFKLIQARLLCAGALGIGSSFELVPQSAQSGTADPADPAPARTSQAIPWSQIGARAGADYQGDGLAIRLTPGGARLRCVFQRLEGEAPAEGLRVTSPVAKGGTQP